ncbi:hypothetical protein TrispH2_011664 [Trichoplax sp. H2]|nr:hypothetical protein TrispH2_011664 [Trichoplax sp. H2]|eukprot:RDD36448.1 hypothetical protein TrispH2_011664 [Trichoplax sp. H2]
MGFFALANSLFVVKLSQFSSISPSQASAIVTFGVVSIVSCPTYVARQVVMGLDYRLSAFSVPIIILIISTAIIGIISFIVVVNLAKRIVPDPSTSYMTISIFNKPVLSIVMILIGIAMFSIGIVLNIRSHQNYGVAATNFSAVMLLSNGVIGIISYQKNVAELDAWYKVIATITSGICITSILFVLQTLTYINNNKKDLQWKDNQFATLRLLYTAIAIIGLIVALIGAKASHYPRDIFDHSIRYSPRSDSNNICMLASALLTGGIGILSLGLLNQEIWGFPTLFIAVTTFTTATIGLDKHYVDGQILDRPYFALNICNSIGSLYTIGLILFTYLVQPYSYTNLHLASWIIPAIVIPSHILSMVLIAYFSIKSAVLAVRSLEDEISEVKA